jgi:hypothetical protein
VSWYFEYLHQCKSFERKVVVLELDFEKSFDTIEHEEFYEILRRKGFLEKFIG